MDKSISSVDDFNFLNSVNDLIESRLSPENIKNYHQICKIAKKALYILVREMIYATTSFFTMPAHRCTLITKENMSSMLIYSTAYDYVMGPTLIWTKLPHYLLLGSVVMYTINTWHYLLGGRVSKNIEEK